MVEDHLCKNTFLTHFGLIFGPKTAHFQGILGFSMGQNASPPAQSAQKTIVCAYKMVEDHLWKNAFLTHFGLIFGPKTAHFQGILGFSMGQNASPPAQSALKTIV